MMKIFDADDPLVVSGQYDEEGYTPKERRAKERKERETMTKKKSTTAASKKTTATQPAAKRPRSQALPGLDDRAIKPLEEIAAEYADIRDRRMALTVEESALKKRALALMHKLNRTEYRRDGVEIRIIAGDEKIAVKILKPESDDEDDETSSVEMTSDSDSDSVDTEH